MATNAAVPATSAAVATARWLTRAGLATTPLAVLSATALMRRVQLRRVRAAKWASPPSIVPSTSANDTSPRSCPFVDHGHRAIAKREHARERFLQRALRQHGGLAPVDARCGVGKWRAALDHSAVDPAIQRAVDAREVDEVAPGAQVAASIAGVVVEERHAYVSAHDVVDANAAETLERGVRADEVVHELVRRMVEQCLGRVVLLQLAVSHQRDPVGEADRLVDVVRHEDDRLLQLALDLDELGLQPVAR